MIEKLLVDIVVFLFASLLVQVSMLIVILARGNTK